MTADEEISSPESQPAAAPDALHWGRWTDWLELVRLPLVFTLISDNVAASILATGSLFPLTAWLPVLAASLCAYWAGMILNDVADIEQDRQQRPNRPLVSGRISPTIAGHVGNVLLIATPVIILGVVSLHHADRRLATWAVISAILLSIAIKSYDSPLKLTWIGPLLMGACRGFHLLMVGLTMYSLLPAPELPRHLFMLAAGTGIYILGVTTYARREAASSSRPTLTFGLALEMVGIGILAALPNWSATRIEWSLDPVTQYPMLIGLISLTVLHQGLRGLATPSPRFVQAAVKHALLTLILLDASMVAMWAGKWAGMATVMLVLPALVSSFRLRST